MWQQQQLKHSIRRLTLGVCFFCLSGRCRGCRMFPRILRNPECQHFQKTSLKNRSSLCSGRGTIANTSEQQSGNLLTRGKFISLINGDWMMRFLNVLRSALFCFQNMVYNRQSPADTDQQQNKPNCITAGGQAIKMFLLLLVRGHLRTSAPIGWVGLRRGVSIALQITQRPPRKSQKIWELALAIRPIRCILATCQSRSGA